MVDTTDLKSVDQMVVRVQVPLPPLQSKFNVDFFVYITSIVFPSTTNLLIPFLLKNRKIYIL